MSELQQGRVIKECDPQNDSQLDSLFEQSEQLQQGKVVAQSHIELEMAETPLETELDSLAKPTKPNWLARIFVLSLLTLVLSEVIFTIIEAISTSPFLAAVYGVAVSTALALVGKVAFREFRLLRKLKNTKIQQHDAARLMQSVQIGEAERFLTKINGHLSNDKLAQVLSKLDAHHTDQEVMSLYASTVLVEQDEKAQNIIKKYASTSGVMVAISPIALVDMAVVLWRSTKMIEDITQVYGLPLGYVSRIKLYRMTLKQMLFAGSAELISDFATTALSAELAGKLSARAAQGVSVSIFTARIGYKAMELSRPLPGLPNKKNLLTSCVKLAIESVKGKESGQSGK
ncbi:TIGR01620 family protein [Pseudoalteromonas sp. MMG024]|uniref:TIGR01620 family protein n=1 Tax=Pseudoalteromonas sp. MMG024 TaxID=2909980 RepID=UPI001F278562|nr:TIGR01620 family protein [Pseudoalteromonas sp. MMG024]MCF6458210.1 YcjF family protein [Pseudoalteromonas sp. MMG024]